MTRQCCKCRRVALGGQWILPTALDQDNVTHTYCPVCLSEVKATLYQRQKARRIAALARSGLFAT